MEFPKEQVVSPNYDYTFIGTKATTYVPQLIGSENYSHWARTLSIYLRQIKLWSIVDDEVPIEQFEAEKLCLGFNEKNESAILCLSSVIGKYTSYLKHNFARNVWAEIKHTNRHNALRYRANLISKLSNIKFNDLSKLDEFHNLFTNIVEQLEAVQTQMSDVYAAMYLRAIPDSAHVIKKQLIPFHGKITIDQLRNALKLEFDYVQNKRTRNEYFSTEDTLQTTDKTLFCKYCKTNTHTINDCSKLKRKNSRRLV